jgi:hypothetical protein
VLRKVMQTRSLIFLNICVSSSTCLSFDLSTLSYGSL